jgi:hypothetical protein
MDRTKKICRCLALVLLLLIAGQTWAQAAYTDVDGGYWASAAIEKWSGCGVLNGSGGSFYPTKPMTRAELMAMLSRIFGYQGGQNPFGDVRETDWYAPDILKAYSKGVLTGSNDPQGVLQARPDAPVTRAEAAAIIVRAFSLRNAGSEQEAFTDAVLPAWAMPAIMTMKAYGYMQGRGGGLFEPDGLLTRAEAAQLLSNIIALFINEGGRYTTDAAGNVVVNAQGVTLDGITITGDLYLADGIGEGRVTLKNVTVTGTTFVSGGGSGLIDIEACDLGRIVVRKAGLTLPVSGNDDTDTEGAAGDTDGSSTADIDG